MVVVNLFVSDLTTEPEVGRILERRLWVEYL